MVLSMMIALNIGVLGLFSLESVTMAELFGSRTRFTQLALAKEIGGILATAIGPVVAAGLTAATGSWWPIAAMLVVYSLITLVSAVLAPETRGRDLVLLEDAAVKAVVVHGANDLRVEDLPDPVAREGEVLVAMEWGGICGSDISYWRNGSSGTAVLKHPLVLGHEVAGHITGIGPGVSGLSVGQPVTVHPATPSGGYFGSAAFDPHTDGGFSELRVVRAEQIRTLPSNVDTEHGALAEPLAVAMHAVNRAGDVRGRDVLVNGAGPIGSLVVAAAKYAGAATVTAADVADAPLKIAKAMGADVVINAGAGEELPADVELGVRGVGRGGGARCGAACDGAGRHGCSGGEPAG